MSTAISLPDVLTVDAFLAWDAPMGTVWQLVDGTPQAMASANPTHGAIQARAGALIDNHLTARNSPCFVVTAPGVVPRVQSDINMRVPDLAVTCSPSLPGDKALRDPVLMIETLSPSNRAETWMNVWSYTTIPSVQEILVLRSDKIGADLLCRGADGAWPERPLAVEDGDLTLESIGYVGPITAFYRNTWLGRG
jgi:Uma2 family endonuclease